MKTILGFSKKYLDSLNVIITWESVGLESKQLWVCRRVRDYISQQPNKQINAEDLVVWANKNKRKVSPVAWCYMQACGNTKEETYFSDLEDIERENSRDYTEEEKKNMLRFLKARVVIKWRKREGY